MFDSRTDKPQRPGGHTYSNGATSRWFREPGVGDRVEWGTPRARVLATRRMGKAAIAEGLTEYALHVNRTVRRLP